MFKNEIEKLKQDLLNEFELKLNELFKNYRS